MESPEQPEVFVVVPSYNHAPFVEKCLRSIIGQTLAPAKLLVVDDGSTDGSPAIIERILKDCPVDCELLARENRGLCETLNEAFALSHGEYFAYLGSDDLWFPNFLEEQTRLLSRRPNAVLAFSHAYLIDEHDNVFDATSEWTEFADGDMQPMLLSGVVFSSPGVLYRRSALAGHEWNKDSKLEDYEMYLRLSVEGEFARNEKVLCAWRQHGVNASTDLPRMFPEIIAAQDRLAPALGIDRAELKKMQSRMKFNAADNFIRNGFRRDAAQLFLENLSAAPSIGKVFDTALRLAVPQTLFQWNRRRKRVRGIAKYGKLEDLMKR